MVEPFGCTIADYSYMASVASITESDVIGDLFAVEFIILSWRSIAAITSHNLP